MAFAKANLNYAKEYSQALAQAYPYTLYFGALWSATKPDVKFLNNNVLLVFSASFQNSRKRRKMMDEVMAPSVEKANFEATEEKTFDNFDLDERIIKVKKTVLFQRQFIGKMATSLHTE